MSRWIAIVGVAALFGVGCGVPDEHEGEEALSQEATFETASQEQRPGDVGAAVTCQPGSLVGTCYDSGGCFVNSACGSTCNAYNNWKCKQYKVTISGTTYYYRQECSVSPTITCGSALTPACKQTCS